MGIKRFSLIVFNTLLITILLAHSGVSGETVPEKKIHGWVIKYFPQKIDILNHIKKSNPEEYQEVLGEIYEKMVYLENEVKNNDPALFKVLIEAEKLEYDSRAIAKELSSTADSALRKKIRSRLSEKLGEIFDIRQLEMKHEINSLEREINDIKRIFEKRKKLKNEIIQNRIHELMLEFDNELEW